METKQTFQLDEVFPNLSSPPIAEAVLELRGIPGVTFSEEKLRSIASDLLPGYKFFGSLNEFQFQVSVADGNPATPVVSVPAWVGIRLQSFDDHFVLQWKNNGLVFSQVKNYSSWTTFLAEFEKVVTQFFRKVAAFQVQRVGLRFINRISQTSTSGLVSNLLRLHPVTPPAGLNLPTKGFFHQDNFELPDSSYGLNRISAIQDEPGVGQFLLLDIDAYWTGDRKVSTSTGIAEELRTLRWIKNKVFFSTIDVSKLKGEPL